MKLKLDRSPTESRSDEVPQTAIEHVADVASQRVDELEVENQKLRRQIQGLAGKLSDAKQEANEARGKLSEYVLTSGGRALLDTPDILTEVRGIAAQLNVLANYLTGAQFVTREEFEGVRADAEFARREVVGVMGRLPV